MVVDHHESAAAEARDVGRDEGEAEGGAHGGVDGVAPELHDLVAEGRAGGVVGHGVVGVLGLAGNAWRKGKQETVVNCLLGCVCA